MANDIVTTIEIQFGGDSGKHLSAEIDSRPDGYNNGDTSFIGGDDVYFLVYMSDGINITDVLTSAGNVYLEKASITIDEEDEWITFANTKEASVSKPITQLVSKTWYGEDLDNITVMDNGTTLRATNKGTAVAQISYKTQPRVYKLNTPTELNGKTKFKIVVVIIAEETST